VQGSQETLIDGSFVNGINAVASAGDINGDGFDDLIIGSPGSSQALIVYGSANPTTSIDLGSLDGTNGSQIVGPQFTGFSVAAAGDVNGDGYADVIIGAGDFNDAKSAYVVFGGPGGLGASFDLSSLNGHNGFVIDSSDPSVAFGLGTTVSAAGDINGDGFADLIVSAPLSAANSDRNAGISYVVFGKSGGFAAAVDVSKLDGSDGFAILGAEADDLSGISVSRAGDFNGDGVDDLIVTTGSNSIVPGTIGGETYLIYGQPSGFGASIDLASLPSSAGFRLDGGGSDLVASAAGDVNGDGFDDIVLGAPNASFSTFFGNNGAGYVVLGGPQSGAATLAGTSSDDLLTSTADNMLVIGDAGNDSLTAVNGHVTLLGGADNDTLSGTGGSDVLKGGPGDDTLLYVDGTSNTNIFSGGPGFDTLMVSGNRDLAALDAQSHYRQFTGIDRINLADGAANTLTLRYLDAVHLPDQPQAAPLQIVGDANDTVDIGAGWTTSQTTMIDGRNFDVYTKAGVQIDIDQTILHVVT
jgi:hypothetical protein